MSYRYNNLFYFILNHVIIIHNYFFHSSFVDELSSPNPPIPNDMCNSFIEKLIRKKQVFGEITRNDMTCREFISPFITTAVKHVQSTKNKKLILRCEEWLDGSRGFGSIDFSVFFEELSLLVCEAKKEDFEKGAAQNIVQMHSAVEVKIRSISNIIVFLFFN